MYSSGIDPALLIGWVAMAYSFSKKNLRVVQLSPLSYLLVVVALRYAWFYTLIPLFPFFAIGVGTVVSDMISIGRNRISPRKSSDGFVPQLANWAS
jgi:hypothetical protein